VSQVIISVYIKDALDDCSNYRGVGLSIMGVLGKIFGRVCIAMGWTARVWFPAVQDFSLHGVQTDCGSPPASYPMGNGCKAAGAWSWQLSSAEFKEGGAILYSPVCLRSIVLNWLSTGTTSRKGTTGKIFTRKNKRNTELTSKDGVYRWYFCRDNSQMY
jgi:hypothetical protein